MTRKDNINDTARTIIIFWGERARQNLQRAIECRSQTFRFLGVKDEFLYDGNDFGL